MPAHATPAIPSDRLILALETSCDETGASVVHGRTVRSNVIASQHDLHAEYRGVVPEIASRAHAERITPIIRQAVADAGIALTDLHAIAVGNRPGLIGSLLVGVSAAKALAWSLGVPCVAVDHVQAHLFAGLMRTTSDSASTQADNLASLFPAVGLVVSGGHTSMYHMQSPTRLHRLGGTIDDAIGEAYDKVANMLNLGFPGGPLVDKLAAQGGPDGQPGNDLAVDFPISRLSPDSLDFSFSGLKTAALYALRGVPHARTDLRPPHTPPAPADLAASFQRAACKAITLKLARVLDRHGPYRAILVGGGVSANSRLRRELTDLATARNIALRLPAMSLCVDNAAMIAGLAGAILDTHLPTWPGDGLTFPAIPTTGLA
ncbi:MAG: tRNA (adenosine(37)-N6)-threonylcarbamoyltransferase complex transferase subunit TsaD [Phycisphaerales bacterium]|nr:tRNA (adenosine(37)-N6)-threonylcarbamoyltransferase complex transferase subunit TsaD [Phycisphaerales bacterium]